MTDISLDIITRTLSLKQEILQRMNVFGRPLILCTDWIMND